MEKHTPIREEAFDLLKKFTKTESLIHHAKAVEGVMRYMAQKHGEDEEKWGLIGLLHDIDYEKFPEEHCLKAKEILDENGWPEDYIRAVVSHGWGICTDIKPQNLLEKTLYAIDELTGLVTACALVRPSKSVNDMKAKSVMKKWKQHNFAAGVNREVIAQGAVMLEIELNDLFTDVIMGMRGVADEIGL
jgi:putative nucleotidyltransferase with HDIG domain